MKWKLPFAEETDGLSIYSDVSPAFPSRIRPFVGTAIAAMPTLPLLAPVQAVEDPYTLYLFKDDSSLLTYTGKTGSGYRSRTEIVIRCDPHSLFETRRRILHEMCHGVMREAGLIRLPRSLKEGFCNFVACHRWQEPRLDLMSVAGKGSKRVDGDFNTIRRKLEQGELALESVLAQERSTLGEGFAVASFLMTNEAAQDVFRRYTNALNSGDGSHGAAVASVSGSLATLDQSYRSHAVALIAQYENGDRPPDLHVVL